MDIVYILIAIVVGYLIGSLPWALIIGKGIFRVDVREHGSGNLGGSNAGRVLGRNVGLAVILLDGFKAFFAVLITLNLTNQSEYAALISGAVATIGHCYPLFARFKGGKAVATTFGYLLALATFVHHDPLLFIVPFLVLLLVLGIGRMISLASMTGVLTSAIYSYVFYEEKLYAGILILLTLFIIYRHRSNIQRIINGTENKVNWIK